MNHVDFQIRNFKLSYGHVKGVIVGPNGNVLPFILDHGNGPWDIEYLKAGFLSRALDCDLMDETADSWAKHIDSIDLAEAFKTGLLRTMLNEFGKNEIAGLQRNHMGRE